MDPVRKIQTQKGEYYSDKCYKENFHLLRAGKEIPHDQFNTINDQIFSVCNTKMRGSYVTLEYNQKRFFFADNELFVYVNSLLQKVFSGTITIKNKKSKEIMKSTDKISISAQYEIEIEKQFTFKNLNDKPDYLKMDFLSTVSDAKKKLSEKFENKIKSDEIKILDENKTEIKNKNQKLIDIPNYENFIFYKIADDSKAKKIFSDLNISKIANDCYGYSNSITNYLVKNGLLYSDKCLKSQLHVYISGKEIKAKDFKNCNDVDDSTISIKNDQNTVSLEYNNMKFIFSNDECISDAIKLIEKTFKGCINVLILDENNINLSPDSKISQNEKYSINTDFKFTFTCISKDEHNTSIVLKYLGTVSDAKNILSINFCKGDQSKIVIFDDNKDEITDNSTKLIDIPNYEKHIYYEIDTSRGESIQIKKAQIKKPLSQSSISSNEIEKKSNKPNQTKEELNRTQKQKIKEIKPNPKEELNKTQKPKIKAIKPSISKAEDPKEENKNTNKKTKKSDDKSNLLTINFVFNDNKFSSFKEELNPETTIEEISKNIKTKYSIKDKIKISYKFGNNFSEIDSSMNINDVREEINIKGKNYLYIDIKKGPSSPKSISKRLVLHPVKNDENEKHHKKPDESSEDSEEKSDDSNKEEEPEDKKSNDSMIEEEEEEPEDKKSNDSMIEEEEEPEDKKSNDSMIEEEEEEPDDDDLSQFKFEFNGKFKIIPLSINDTLFDSEQIIKKKFKIDEANKIDFFIEDEIIEDKDTLMELLLNKTIIIEIRKVKKNKDGKKTYSYKYQTNRDEDVHIAELDESATVLSMKTQIADVYDVDNLADIKIIFAGKDLLNNIVLKDLNVGDIILYIYIRTTDDILLMTARGLRV